jgi:predicted amino acid-binding ACT domain protein
MNAKLKVSFKDRIGIVADISRLIARHGMNIASMEVIRKHDEAHVYVEVESGKSAVDQKALFSFLSTIEDIINIDLIHMLPMEEQANRLRGGSRQYQRRGHFRGQVRHYHNHEHGCRQCFRSDRG